MAYEPTNWKTGDIITADKMNSLESRSAQAYCVKWELVNSNSTPTYLLGNLKDVIADFSIGKYVTLISEFAYNNQTATAFNQTITIFPNILIGCHYNNDTKKVVLVTSQAKIEDNQFKRINRWFEFDLSNGFNSIYDAENNRTKINNYKTNEIGG